MDVELTPEQHERMIELMEELTAILQPGPDQRLYVAVASTEELDELTEGYEVADDERAIDSVEVVPNAVHIHTREPVHSRTQEQDINRHNTLEFLDEIRSAVREGQLRDFVMVAGVDEGDLTMRGTSTMISHGAVEQLALFLGGLALAQAEMQRIALDPYGDFMEE